LDTSVIHPATPLGSPPVRRPGADELGEAALTALRRHPDALALLAAGPAPDWFALGSDAREALRDVADSVAVLLRKPGPGPLARYAEQQRAEAARLRAENARLTAVIDAAQPHRTPAELAALLYAAYIGIVRAAMPDGITFADWDQLDDDPMAVIARDAFTAVAQVALEPVKADYDQAAELLGLRAQLAEAQAELTRRGVKLAEVTEQYANYASHGGAERLFELDADVKALRSLISDLLDRSGLSPSEQAEWRERAGLDNIPEASDDQ
jgi:hypothetical protein